MSYNCVSRLHALLKRMHECGVQYVASIRGKDALRRLFFFHID